MLYAIPEEITIGDYSTEWNKNLSDTDKYYAYKWYPGGFKNRTEPHGGHVHWAIIHSISVVQSEVSKDSQRTLDILDAVSKEQLDEIFGYLKNGRLMITTGKTEPHEGHVHWTLGQTLEVVKQEIINDANLVMEMKNSSLFNVSN